MVNNDEAEPTKLEVVANYGGKTFFILGLLALLVQFVLVLRGLMTETGLFGISLGLISVGLGSIAIAAAKKSDRHYDALHGKLRNTVAEFPRMLAHDILTPLGLQKAKEQEHKESQAQAQKRINEDTKRVGCVRGEVFQKEDGTWAVAWVG